MSANKMTATILTGLLFAFQTTLGFAAQTTGCQENREYSLGQADETDLEAKKQYFQEQFINAENLRLKAAGAGAEWLQTEDLLIQSRTLADQDQWNTAFQLVHKACLQSEMALQQAVSESSAWKRRVID